MISSNCSSVCVGSLIKSKSSELTQSFILKVLTVAVLKTKFATVVFVLFISLI